MSTSSEGRASGAQNQRHAPVRARAPPAAAVHAPPAFPASSAATAEPCTTACKFPQRVTEAHRCPGHDTNVAGRARGGAAQQAGISNLSALCISWGRAAWAVAAAAIKGCRGKGLNIPGLQHSVTTAASGEAQARHTVVRQTCAQAETEGGDGESTDARGVAARGCARSAGLQRGGARGDV